MTEPPQPSSNPTAPPGRQPPSDRSAPATDEFRWQHLFQQTSEPLFLLNRRRRLLFANTAWEELTGIPLSEARDVACIPIQEALARLRKRQKQARRRQRPPGPEAGTREAVLAALAPPAEVLEGHPAQVRRASAAGSGRRFWDVAYLPLLDEHGLLAILGRITPGPVEPAADVLPLPARLLGLGDRLARWHQPDHPPHEGPLLYRLNEQTRLAAQSAVPVLLLGEPGSGKRWLARSIHQQSRAGGGAFVCLDCARLPASALAAVLFDDSGLTQRPGVGTLYLHEPQGLPRELQTRLVDLLCASRDREAERPPPRLMAGCSADPVAEVRAGRLVEELYCGVAVLTIAVPPLRERLADFDWLLGRLLERAGGSRPIGLSPSACDALRSAPWRRNLAELHGVLQAACGRARSERVEAADLPWHLRGGTQPPERTLSLKAILEEVERRLIVLALKEAKNNKTRAARLLSIWRPLLLRRMEKLGIADSLDEGGGRSSRHRIAMRRAQLLVYEADGRLTEALRDGAARQGWWLRELRHEASVREILRPGEGTVLVLKVGRDLEAEMGLLEEVGWLFPAVDVVLVGDVDNPALANLGWDLGARFVLFPPLPRMLLPEIVAGLLGGSSPLEAPASVPG